MGGASVSTFAREGKTGVWSGEVKVVQSLGAPGFCTLRTKDSEVPPPPPPPAAAASNHGAHDATRRVMHGITHHETRRTAHNMHMHMHMHMHKSSPVTHRSSRTPPPPHTSASPSPMAPAYPPETSR